MAQPFMESAVLVVFAMMSATGKSALDIIEPFIVQASYLAPYL
jgi:hypothetical protein